MFEDFYYSTNLSETPPEILRKRGLVPFTISMMQCCGMRELYTTPGLTCFSKKAFLQWAEYMLIGEGDNGWKSQTLPGRPRTGMMVVAVHKETTQKIEWLRAMDFKELTDFKNHVHGTVLKLFGWQVPEDLKNYRFQAPLVPEKKKEEAQFCA